MKLAISYRRQDTEQIVGRISDRLKARFGASNVFLDTDNIPVGTDFRTFVSRQIAECDKLVAVVGAHWAGARDQGPARIMERDDPVRFELETAYSLSKSVVPVRIGLAEMPREDMVPETLKWFPTVNAARIDPGGKFNSDINDFMEALEGSRANPGQAPSQDTVKLTDKTSVPLGVKVKTGGQPEHEKLIEAITAAPKSRSELADLAGISEKMVDNILRKYVVSGLIVLDNDTYFQKI